jgi:hypothetical protein
MIPRHANELLSRLEDVANVGCTVVNRNLLLHWYGQERLTIGIWRDIQEKWHEVLDQSTWSNKKVPLLASDADHGFVTLIWGDGLTTDGTWLKNVTHLAAAKKSKYASAD